MIFNVAASKHTYYIDIHACNHVCTCADMHVCVQVSAYILYVHVDYLLCISAGVRRHAGMWAWRPWRSVVM